MQLLADTLNKPIYVSESDYAPALGAAVYAAVAAGLYEDVNAASNKLGSKIEAEYHPNIVNIDHMKKYYKSYEELAIFIESNINKKQLHELEI